MRFGVESYSILYFMADVITCNPFNIQDHINGSDGAIQWNGYFVSDLKKNTVLPMPAMMLIAYARQFNYIAAPVSVGNTLVMLSGSGQSYGLNFVDSTHITFDNAMTSNLVGDVSAIFAVTDFNEPTP